MAKAEIQARQLLSEAEKKLSSKGLLQFFFKIFRNRNEEAIECYQKAGNLFKLSKNWSEAAFAFKTAADLNLEENNRFEAANYFVQSSKCLEKLDVTAAIKILLTAIDIYTDIGQFVMAAKLHDRIGEIYESNLNLNEAIRHYEQASDYYKMEEQFLSAKKCVLKVAEYTSSEFHNYIKAICIFEDVASYDSKTPILHYYVKDHLFKAVLCHLCIDLLNAKGAMEFYANKFPSFDATPQFTFLKAVIQFVEDSDEEAFNKAVKEFNNSCKLDAWHQKILTQIKKQINEHNLL